jgi:oligosaccharyl transferase (archaeosortase A-associated)
MNQSRLSPELVAAIIVALLFGVALYFRIVLPYDQVFSGNWIKTTGVDGWYHMRLVDNLAHHFPHRITFDPYTFYPHGSTVIWPPFYGWLIAGTVWLVSLGSPTQHIIDVVGAYVPAILGALTIIPVYFIGKELFNRWVGVLSAGLIAIISGEFLGRSTLGYTDHHAAEALFTTVAILFLILAVKAAKQGQLSFSHVKRRDWAALKKPLIYSLLTGLFLGVYLLTWVGGLLFVFLIFAYFIIQLIVDHLRNQSTDYLAIISVPLFLVSAAISLPIVSRMSWLGPLFLPSFVIAVLTPVALVMLSRLMSARHLAVAYYPLVLLGLGLAGLAVFYIIDPSLVKSMVARFGIFAPSGSALTILEVQPLLFPGGNFSLSAAWVEFTTGFFLSFISLAILIYLIIKRGEADKTLLVVWSLVMLLATLGQRRFAYYFAVNVALLTGYLSWRVLQFFEFKETAAEPGKTAGKKAKKRVKAKKAEKASFRITGKKVFMAFGVVIIFFSVYFPNIGLAISNAKAAPFAPSDAWCESLSWLKENTPDPFGNPDFYYQLYQPPPQGEDYKYPESAYGVMAWWDYGHWITRIAHRIPVCNPFQQGVSQAARFFTAQDEASADEIMAKLGARYVIIDSDTATGKLQAAATWAGLSPENLTEVYYVLQGDSLVPVWVFYPDYYRSITARLYNFDGEKVSPASCTVILYEERKSSGGVLYKEITGHWSFSTYEAAVDYISKQQSGDYEIVGTDPFMSPVPLEGLEHYKLVYSSETSTMQPDVGMMPAVKIFEYEG